MSARCFNGVMDSKVYQSPPNQTTVSPSGIRLQIDRLEKVVVTLESAIVGMEAHLESVLRPAPNNYDDSGSELDQAVSSVAIKLNDLYNKLNHHVFKIKRLAARLDI